MEIIVFLSIVIAVVAEFREPSALAEIGRAHV